MARFASLLLALPLLIAAAQAAELPPSVDAALSEAEARDGLRVSYTMTFKWPEVDDVVARYDARADEWTLVSGDPKALDKNGRKKFETYKKVESEPGGLLYADYRKHLKEVAPLNDSDADGAQEFKFLSPQTPHSLEEAEGVVETRLAIDEAGGHLTRYFVKALQPFSPNVAISLKDFEFDQRFERIDGDGPAVMTAVYWRAKGRKVLKKVDEEYRVLFTDFEIVEDPGATASTE